MTNEMPKVEDMTTEDQASFDSIESYCHCGTITEAIEVAERLFIETTAMNCPTWSLQVATAFSVMCERHFQTTKMTQEEFAALIHVMIVKTVDHGQKPEDLKKLSIEYHKKHFDI